MIRGQAKTANIPPIIVTICQAVWTNHCKKEEVTGLLKEETLTPDFLLQEGERMIYKQNRFTFQ